MKRKFSNVFILAIFTASVSSFSAADEIGGGRPNIEPDSTEPTPIESESSWWNELLEWFEYDNS